MLSYLYYVLTTKMYSMMTVPELKEALRKRKVSVVSKKAVLIQRSVQNESLKLFRLAAYDRNAIFGGEDVDEDDVYEVPSDQLNLSEILTRILFCLRSQKNIFKPLLKDFRHSSRADRCVSHDFY